MVKVSCIIVTYNGMKWIDKCLSTIKEDKIDLEIIVIDNNSTDGTIEYIKTNFPDVKFYPQYKNIGFAAANNLGYEKALENGSEFIYLLNQDTISYPDNIFKLIASQNMLDEKIGYISPIHLNDDGSNLDMMFEKYISANSCPNIISDLLLDKKKGLYEIKFVNAACWLLNVNTIKHVGGLFSSAFFHYGEDMNFDSRLSYFGYKNYIHTDVYIHHCREERKGKKTKEFLKKEVLISAKIKLLNVNVPLKESVLLIIKISTYQLFKGNFQNFFNLIQLPTIKFFELKSFRKSYLNKKIL